jgi:hypothetical protein
MVHDLQTFWLQTYTNLRNTNAGVMSMIWCLTLEVNNDASLEPHQYYDLMSSKLKSNNVFENSLLTYKVICKFNQKSTQNSTFCMYISTFRAISSYARAACPLFTHQNRINYVHCVSSRHMGQHWTFKYTSIWHITMTINIVKLYKTHHKKYTNAQFSPYVCTYVHVYFTTN